MGTFSTLYWRQRSIRVILLHFRILPIGRSRRPPAPHCRSRRSGQSISVKLAQENIWVLHITYFHMVEDELKAWGETDHTIGHGGEWETSLLLHLCRHMVALEKLTPNGLKPWFSSPELERFARWPERRREADEGVMGDPFKASEDKGKALFKAAVKKRMKVSNEIQEKPRRTGSSSIFAPATFAGPSISLSHICSRINKAIRERDLSGLQVPAKDSNISIRRAILPASEDLGAAKFPITWAAVIAWVTTSAASSTRWIGLACQKTRWSAFRPIMVVTSARVRTA